VALITKIDMAAAAEFDREAARGNILRVRPGMRIHEVSSKNGEGMAEVEAFFEGQLRVGFGDRWAGKFP
jgi:hydrogenase nickel incorporation protein HypB